MRWGRGWPWPFYPSHLNGTSFCPTTANVLLTLSLRVSLFKSISLFILHLTWLSLFLTRCVCWRIKDPVYPWTDAARVEVDYSEWVSVPDSEPGACCFEARFHMTECVCSRASVHVCYSAFEFMRCHTSILLLFSSTRAKHRHYKMSLY